MKKIFKQVLFFAGSSLDHSRGIDRHPYNAKTMIMKDSEFLSDVEKKVKGFLSKRFPDLVDKIDDIIQDALKNVLEKYAEDVLNDQRQFKPLVFTTAKHLAIAEGKIHSRNVKNQTSLNQNNSWLQVFIENQIVERGKVDYNQGERTFLKADVSSILEDMNNKYPNYVYILQKYMTLELSEERNHDEIVSKIKNEYYKLFGIKLTVFNYRTLKGRAIKKFEELWKKK